MARMLDLHIHPGMKMFYLPYLGNNFHALTYAGRHWNPLSFRTRYGNLKNSPEKVMVVAHYVIERGFVAKGLKWFTRAIAWTAAPTFYGRLRRAEPWETLLKQMDGLERAVANTNRFVLGKGPRFKMIYSVEDIDNLADNEIALVHAIEGSHVFGYELEPGQTLEQYWARTQDRLFYLKQRGVCMLTLSHFWDNMFAPQGESTEIIASKKNGDVVAHKDDALFHMIPASWEHDDSNHLFEPMVRKLLELGIIIDVSHMAYAARQRVYELCEEYGRPVVASHVGLKRFFDHEYNLSDDEVLRIHKMGGVVGLIFSRRWLVDPIKRYETKKSGGIPDLIENMLYIRELTGSIDAIGVGTDLDGLTDPFKDCPTPAELDNVLDAMRAHFTEDEIDQILYRNGLRLLRKGWGGRNETHSK